jgi:DNA polymerase III alpha subunit
MRTDNYGQQVLDETDLCNIYLSNPEQIINNGLTSDHINFDDILDLVNKPTLINYAEQSLSLEQFDTALQNNWYMSEEYKTFDIAKHVLDLCKTEPELQRVGEELIMFQERDMFVLLRYCKYLVDTMRKHNIVWGVGRGSSVASYVLYLLGIHRINSLHYDLSIDEFLK